MTDTQEERGFVGATRGKPLNIFKWKTKEKKKTK